MNTLRLQGIRKSLRSHVVATGLDFDFRAGVIHGVIGANGAGKTSFLNLLSGFITPDSGTIVFRGENITKKSASYRARLGFRRSFQTSRTYRSLSVADNVLIDVPCAVDRTPLGFVVPAGQSTEEQAQLARMESLWNSWMTGTAQAWSHTRHRLAGELSLGESRAFELMRLFLGHPTVLLLDEPTAGLAAALLPPLAREIAGLAAAGATVIVVSHESAFLSTINAETYRLNSGSLIATP